MTASGLMGRNTPTVSPAPTPRWRRALARRFTSRASSSCVSVRVSACSDSQITAGWLPRPAAMLRSQQLAVRFVSPPGNHWGQAMPREASRTRVYGRVNVQPRSRTTASQYHSGSSIERRWSAASDSSPCAAMKRAMRVRAAKAGSGRQTISSRLMAAILL